MSTEELKSSKKVKPKDNLSNILDVDTEVKKEIYELTKVLSSGIKRWEKAIYPIMIVFVVLAFYGFYLIYHVTNDMSKISKSVVEMNFSVSQMTASIFQMVTITGIQMGNIDTQMKNINTSMSDMSGKMDSIVKMGDSLQQMNRTLNGMYQSVYYMGQTTGQMNSNFSELNENISKPLDSMNNIMPWSMFSSKKYNNNQNRYPAPSRPIYSPYLNSPRNKQHVIPTIPKERKDEAK